MGGYAMNPTETFQERLSSPTRHPVAMWEVYDKDRMNWLTLTDVLSFSISVMRDDDRPILYTAAPPISRATLTLANKNKVYTFANSASRFTGIINADAFIRAFIGYAGSDMTRTFRQIPKASFAYDTTDYYATFAEGARFYNTKVTPSGYVSVAKGTTYDYSAEDRAFIPFVFYGDVNYTTSSPTYAYPAFYVSRVFEVGLEDASVATPSMTSLSLSWAGNAGEVLDVTYRISDAYTPSSLAWTSAVAAASSLTLRGRGRYMQYALGWAFSSWAGTHTREVAGAHMTANTHYEVYPAFFGRVDVPTLRSNAKESVLALTARSSLKAILDERVGALSFTSSIALEEMVASVLAKSSYFTDDTHTPFEATGKTVDVGGGLTLPKGRTIKEHLRDILSVAYGYDESEHRAYFFRLFDDEHGRIRFKKEEAYLVADGVFSYRENLKEVERYYDVHKMVNEQTVIGHLSSVAYAEQTVATTNVSLLATEYEKDVVISLTPSAPASASSPVTHINFSYTNDTVAFVYENNALLAGDVSRKSYNATAGHGELGLTVRNKSYAVGPATSCATTISVYATPLRVAATYVGEAADGASINTYGKKTGRVIESPFVTSRTQAEEIAKAIVAYRKAPFQRATCTFVDGALLPFVRLNETYRIFELATDLYDLFIVTRITHAFQGGRANTVIEMESGGITEDPQTYDYNGSERTSDEDVFYDGGRVYDERLSGESEETLPNRVTFS